MRLSYQTADPVTTAGAADDKIGEAFNEIKQLKDRLEQENIYLSEEIEVLQA